MEIEELSPIQKFYYGKNIFITGVTGLLGKVLFEKILRRCPGVGNIYLLMREKRGKTAEQRLEAMLDSQLFKQVIQKYPDIKKNIHIIYGDTEKPNLGMNPQDIMTLKENVAIVFHAAAKLKFDEKLRAAVNCHVISLKDLLNLLKEFKKLQSFVYISTSFVHRDPDFTVPEHVSKECVSPNQLLDALKWMDDEAVESVSKVLLKKFNNTYLLTKALAENVLEEDHGEVPTVILRPCFIAPTYKDPFPGWCDTMQGIQGLMLAGAKGFLRTLYSPKGLKVNVIPADVVANACIATAWHIATYKQDDILVVNSVIDYERLPLADEQLLVVALAKRTLYPLVSMYRYPDFTIYHHPFPYYIHSFFDHWIPAVIGDTFLFIFTGKTLMVRLYRKINYLYGIFLELGLDPWICKVKNYHMIEDHLNKKDSELFPLNTDDLNWEQYIEECLYAGRINLAKEDPSNIPYAKKKAQVWYVVTTLMKWALIFYLMYYICSKFMNTNEPGVLLEATSSYKI